MNHHQGRWDPRDLSFEIQDDLTYDPIVTIRVSTPGGAFRFMAEPEIVGTTLILRGLHVQDAYANAFGAAKLRLLAQVVMERMQFDEVVVEGAV